MRSLRNSIPVILILNWVVQTAVATSCVPAFPAFFVLVDSDEKALFDYRKDGLTDKQCQICEVICKCLNGNFDGALHDSSLIPSPETSQIDLWKAFAHYGKGKQDSAVAILLNCDESLVNNDAWATWLLGTDALKKQKLKAAKKYLLRSIHIDRSNPEVVEQLSYLVEDETQWIRIMSDLLRVRPDLMGEYCHIPNFPPSKVDLAHGKSQVLQMRVDRPLIDEILKPHPELVSWLETRFAGAGEGRRITWSSKPQSERVRQFGGASRLGAYGKPTTVWFDGDAKLSGERQLSILIFELLNCETERHGLPITISKLHGKVSREDYVLRMAEREYKVLQRLRAFYVCCHEDFGYQASEPHLFGLRSSFAFERWLQTLPQSHAYFDYYREQFDESPK